MPHKIRSRISEHITPFQHDFLPGRSATTQLLHEVHLALHEVNQNLDKNVQTDITFLDFSKAFDSVHHNLILHKLKSFGFHGGLLNWFSGYLQHRRQHVVIEGTSSAWMPVKSGVQQGSLLSPVLFLLYSNELVFELSEGTNMLCMPMMLKSADQSVPLKTVKYFNLILRN